MARRNPLFPYIYRLGMPVFDRLFYRRYRREAMTHAFGRLLMVGLGPGTDLLFLPAAVTSVAAVEPEAAMRRMASALAHRRAIAIDIVDGIGESIPFPDNSFDSVHIGLVLCSVDDVAATLAEIRRVLAPGGRLVVLEHVRGDGLMGWFQDLIAKPWSWLASGCGRIRYRGMTQYPTHPGAASLHSSPTRIRHRYRMSAVHRLINRYLLFSCC
jgi:ubiquinone/menaquinone biosynthesis C-methylase UbiE